MPWIIVEYFFSPTSSECKEFMRMVVTPLMQRFRKDVEWKVYNIYDARAKKLADQYGIKGVPALVINGKEIVVGFKPPRVIEEKIMEMLNLSKTR
ncbi:MAG: thioredoxin fold domain-containing protein [Candidatus Freyarchaeota archaeon]|nr:thioredoxin family protein [Candidatus Freyrarchaeum guaymaensis]HDO80033.1 thioredoxin [Candidatus Bathyarchaeota archaeon]